MAFNSPARNIDGVDASTYRTQHIRQLVAAAGGPTDFANRYGAGRWTQMQVSQWISATNPKGIGRKLARDLEAALGLSGGVLDLPPNAAAPVSQSLKLDPVILAESIAALRQVAKNRGWSYDPELHAESTCYAYELWHELPSAPSTADVIDIGERIAERLRADVERANAGNGQESRAGAGADDRGRSGQGGTRKARAAGGAQ